MSVIKEVPDRRNPAGLSQRAAAIRWVVIAAVLFVAAWVAPFTALAHRRLVALFTLPVAAAAVVALIRWPDIGFPLAVVVSLLVPFSIGTGTQTGINASVLLVAGLVGMWLFDMVARRREIRLVASTVVHPLLALMAVSVISLGFGQLPWLPIRPASLNAQIGGLMILLLCPAAFLLVAHRLRSLRALEWMTWLFIGLGGIFIACIVFPALRNIGLRLFQRAVLDAMFWTWIVALAFSQALLNRKLAVGWRLGLAVVGLGAFYVTILVRGSWTSGWLPALVSVVTILAVLRPKPVLAVGILVGLIVLLRPSLLGSVFLSGDNEYSMSTRLEAWQILWQIIRLSPILGVGPANYYSYTTLFAIRGYAVSFNSHNNYVDIVAQTGLLGLACFVWFAVEAGRLLWRLRNRFPDGFPRAYIYGAIGGLAATLVSGMFGDWFLPFVYNVGMEGFRASGLAWMFLGAAVALEEIHRGMAPPVTAPPPAELQDYVYRRRGPRALPDPD
jgi:O-antigen ligase